MRVVTFKVEEDLLEKLDSFARLEGVTRSEIIRKAIELYLRLKLPQYDFFKNNYKRVTLYS